MLTITPQAIEKIGSFYKNDDSTKGKCLRLSLKETGCAGYEYIFAFDEKKDGDTVVSQNGFELVVDKNSIGFVQDAVVDYHEDAMGGGFKIKNPQEKGSCGCGKSKSF